MLPSRIAICIALVYLLSAVPIYASELQSSVVHFSGQITYNPRRLSAIGTSIVDGLGNQVKLVGTNIDSNEYESSYFSLGDLQTIKASGGNCIEIHQLRVGDMMPQRDIIDESYFVNHVDKWVSLAEQTQIYCVLSIREFRWFSYGAGMPDWMLDGHGYGSAPYDESTVARAFVDFFDTNNPLQNDNRQCFIDLWKFISNRYKNNPFALFGLMNEPLCHVSLTNTQAVHLGITYSAYMEQVVDGIRSVGNDNLIFIDRPYVLDWQKVQPVNRANVVWEDHLYITPSRDITEWESLMQAQIVRRFAVDFQKPVYIGEYGFDPFSMYENYTSWPADLATQVAFLKTSNVAGYSWHTWGLLNGEYYNILNATQSDYVLRTIFG